MQMHPVTHPLHIKQDKYVQAYPNKSLSIIASFISSCCFELDQFELDIILGHPLGSYYASKYFKGARQIKSNHFYWSTEQ